jgi:hypothetical protein
MKTYLLLVGKILLLTVLYFILSIVGSSFLGPDLDASSMAGQETFALFGMLVVSLVNTLVVSLIILRSRWGGWRLMLAVAFSLYGVMTFMAQIEAAWFGPVLGIPPEVLPWLLAQSLPIVLIFVPLAVLIWGKAHHPTDADDGNTRLQMPWFEWVWKLAVIAVVYVALYFGFGFVVAWQNPELRAMYGNGVNTEVFSYVRLVPWQLARGIMWAMFALPIIRMTRGSVWQVALIVGLLFALPMNIVHILPNPFMPDPSVRLSHFIETASSNFIFGMFVAWLLIWRPQHATELTPAGRSM